MRYPIHDKNVVIDILDVMVKNAKTISNSSLTAVCNGLSMSNKLNLHENVAIFLNAMLPQVPRFDVNSCASLLAFASINRVRNPRLLEAVAKRLETLKDFPESYEVHHIDWLASAFVDLDCPSSSPVFQTILSMVKNYAVMTSKRQELKSIKEDLVVDNANTNESDEISSNEKSHLSSNSLEECQNGGQRVVIAEDKDNEEESINEIICQHLHKRLASIICSIMHGGIYPKSLISKALSPDVLNRVFGKFLFSIIS
jgi:hypothetical protein